MENIKQFKKYKCFQLAVWNRKQLKSNSINEGCKTKTILRGLAVQPLVLRRISLIFSG